MHRLANCSGARWRARNPRPSIETAGRAAAAATAGRRRWRGAAAAAAPPSTAGAGSRVDAALAEWIRQGGGDVQGVRLVVSEGPDGGVDRQLLAAKDLIPGERLITVPRALQVRDIGTTDPRLEALQASAPRAAGRETAAWQFRMALQLVAYRLEGAGGSHAAYIETLPGVAPGVPTPWVAMSLSPADLEQLQDPRLAADAAGQAHFAAEFAAGLLAALPGTPGDPFGGQRVTEELLRWGLALAMSRSFGFRQTAGHAMVPLIDMANHSFTSNAEIRADESGTVTMIANKPVAAGDPILLRYGTHGNSDLLLSYGFVAAENPFDSYAFPMDLDFVLSAVQQFVGASSPTARPSDGLKTWQRGVLAEMGLMPGGAPQQQQQQQQRRKKSSQEQQQQPQQQGEEEEKQRHEEAAAGSGDASPAPVFVSIGGDPPVSGPLLAALRAMLSEDRKAVKGRTPEQLGDWDNPISRSHEAVVMKALVGLCTVLYKSFPTSIQEDARLLAAASDAAAAAASGSNGSGGQGGGGGALSEGARLAVEYRLASKRGLEAATRRLLVRMKELLA